MVLGLGIDIGLKNTALVLLDFPDGIGACDTVDDLLKRRWSVLRAENLCMDGGSVSGDVVEQLHAKLTATDATGFSWAAEAASDDLDVIVIEQQNGRFSPQNYALQTALQMWALSHVWRGGGSTRVVTVNNSHKLLRMARYGLIEDRAVVDADTHKKRATHHFNKKDVVEWVRTQATTEHAGVLDMLNANAAKPDDVCDALTHVLSWFWEKCESPAMRKALKLPRPVVRRAAAPKKKRKAAAAAAADTPSAKRSRV
jgi:hypothetical protein